MTASTGATMADTDNQQFQAAAAANAPPVTAPDTASVTEGTTTRAPTLSGNVLANDTDDGGPTGLRIVSWQYGGATYSTGQAPNLSSGQFFLGTNGGYTFIPNDDFVVVNRLAPGQTLVEEITYTVQDAAGATSTGTLTLTIHGANDAPTFTGSAWGTYEGFGVQSVPLFYNGSDPEGSPISVVAPATLPPGFSIDFTTNRLVFDSNHPDYKSLGQGQQKHVFVDFGVSDGEAVKWSNVWVQIQGWNDAPVAPDIRVDVIEGGAPITINALQNAYDVDAGTVLRVGSVSGPPPAITWDPATQTFTVDPNHPSYDFVRAGQTVGLGVSYTITDGLTETRTVAWVYVTGKNDLPTANADTGAAREAGASGGGLSAIGNVLTNDTDRDSLDSKTVSAVTFNGASGVVGQAFAGAYGTLTLQANGQYLYRANDSLAAVNQLKDGQTLTEVFNYTMVDGSGATAASTLTITINGMNDAPRVQYNLLLRGAEGDAPETFDARLFVSDPEDPLTIVNMPATLFPGLTYDPATQQFTFDAGDPAFDHLAAGVVQRATISYGVSDGSATATQRLSLELTGVNDAPVAAAIPVAEATEGGATVAIDGLAGASDVDDGTVLQVAAPAELPPGVTYANGVFALDPAHAAFDSLAAGETRTVSVDFQVGDGALSVARTASWRVTGANDAPTAQNDAGAADEKQTVVLDVLANDRDPDANDQLTIVSVGASAEGSGIRIVDGKIAFTPGAGYDLLGPGQTGQETFTYTLRDSGGAESTASVTVTVRGVADGAAIAGTNKSEILTGDGLDQQIAGGAGEDVLRGLAGADRLFGDNGKDELHGGDGWDALDGGTGADRLDGGAGADSLTGGTGPDLFVFEGGGFGQDVITDLSEEDQLQFSRGVFADFAALKAHAAQVGGDVVITLDAQNTVTLQGVSLASLDARDFLFA